MTESKYSYLESSDFYKHFDSILKKEMTPEKYSFVLGGIQTMIDIMCDHEKTKCLLSLRTACIEIDKLMEEGHAVIATKTVTTLLEGVLKTILNS